MVRIRSQPRRRRGTLERPDSPLNLRLLLASFGLVTSAILAFLCWRAGLTVLALICTALAVVAAVDLVVIQLRRAARRREEPGVRHSWFE